MKRQYVSLLAVIPSVSGFLLSCYDKTNKSTGALQSDSIQVNRTAHLFNDTTKPARSIIINFACPVESSDDMLKDSLNTYLIFVRFGDRYIGEGPEAVMKQYVKNYIDEYRHDQEPMHAEDERDKENDIAVGVWYFYCKSVGNHVQPYEKDLLAYHVNYNEYAGGVYGMYMSTFPNVDLTLMRPLHLDDIFISDLQEAPIDLIWNQLMADNKVITHEALEDMGYVSTEDIAPTESSYLSKEGITFYYNIYDITPYSVGPVRAAIPCSMMEHLLGSNPTLGDLKD